MQFIIQLEIWGKTQCESERRCKSDLEEILGADIPPSSKVTWPELKCISIRRKRIVDLWWVNMSTYNFFVCGPKFANFFLFNAGAVVLFNTVYSLSIFSSVPEIFALNVKRFPK